MKRDVNVVPLTSDVDLGIAVRYHPPTAVGIDRLVNALAVQESYGRPAFVVDLGTATTIDVLDESGTYIGGAIAPGIETSLEGLFKVAFQLPRLALTTPSRAPGRPQSRVSARERCLATPVWSTASSSGFQAEMEGDPVVVGTGGLAPLVAPHTRHVQIVAPDLTLQGLRIAYEKTRPRPVNDA